MTDTIAQELLDVLACPVDKGEVRLNKSKTALVCAKCKAEYALKDGIPVLLPK